MEFASVIERDDAGDTPLTFSCKPCGVSVFVSQMDKLGSEK